MKTTKTFLALSITVILASNAFAAAPAETLPSGVKVVHDVDGAGTCPGSRCVDRSDVGSGTYCGVVVDSAGREGTTSIRRRLRPMSPVVHLLRSAARPTRATGQTGGPPCLAYLLPA